MTRGNTWHTKASATARGNLAAAVSDNKLYVLGGSNALNAAVTVVEMYDPSTDTWSSKYAIPTAVAGAAAAEVDGIYEFSGTLDGNTVLRRKDFEVKFV